MGEHAGTSIRGCVGRGRTSTGGCVGASTDGCQGCGAEVRIGEEIGTVVEGNGPEGIEIRVDVGIELVNKGDGEG